MNEANEKTFRFTCPECFVSLKARVGQSGIRLACPSCSASVVVPNAPQRESVAGQTDRTIDAPAAESGGEYGIQKSDAVRGEASDLITVTCPICATRCSTQRTKLGQQIRCVECGTLLQVAEAPKSLGQSRRPQKIDQAGVGEYGVSSSEQSAAVRQEVTIPFHCRLCGTLLRGTLADVGRKLTCPDCGTKTVVPPQKKIDAKAVVGAAAMADLGEYGLCEPNVGVASDIPVICSLCSSRLMARADQVGMTIQCPDCGTETVVAAPAHTETGAVMGALSEKGRATGKNYGVSGPQADTAAALVTRAEVRLECPACGRDVTASTRGGKRNVPCPDCGTAIPVPEQTVPASAAPPPPAETLVEKVVHIGVDCPRCGTRIHATDRQVGKKVRCPDCDTPITVPPPKASAKAEEQIVRDGEEYGVGAPPEVVSQVPKIGRAVPRDPADDPDFDFLHKADGTQMHWQLPDMSDRFGFLGHPDALSRWLAFGFGGVPVFLVPAVALWLLEKSSLGGSQAVGWFLACGAFGVAGLVFLAWSGLFSVNLVAIVEDTAAGNRIVRNWPEGNWTEQIGESFYVFNSCMVSFVPVTVLLQNYAPARPFAMYLYVAGFWLTLPVVLLSMLESGSAFSPVSGNVAASCYRRPGAWAWFYLRSFWLVVVGVVIYMIFWQYVCGPFALPALAPLATTLAMVYARWLGILAIRVQEMIEAAAEAREGKDG